MPKLKCDVFVTDRQYGRAGPCERKDVKIVRWAPTPIRTIIYRLCSTHKAQLERGKLEMAR